MGPGHRPGADPGDRLAGPAGRAVVPPQRRAPRPGARAHRARARPVLLGAEDALAARHPHDRGRGHHHRHLAGAPAVRCVRDRRLHREPLAPARPRCRGVVARAARPVRPRRRADAACGRQRRGGGGDGPVRSLAAGDRADRRPAGRPTGAGVPRARHGQVHLRHRRLRARADRSSCGALGVGPDVVGGLAAGVRDVVLPGRSGLHRGLGGAVGRRCRVPRQC